MRLVIADCSVRYEGRLNALLPLARRLLMLKADGSVLVHSDGGSYKPLNWMSPPAKLHVGEPTPEQIAEGVRESWIVQAAKSDDRLLIDVYEIHEDIGHDLGVDPGLIKDGVEADLQRLLAEQITLLGEDFSLVRREYPTAIGPVDILARDGSGASVAVANNSPAISNCSTAILCCGLCAVSSQLNRSNHKPALWPTTAVLNV